jgi:hypothetical protein
MLNRFCRARRDVLGLMCWHESDVPNTSASSTGTFLFQQQLQIRHLVSLTMITKLRVYDNNTEFPESMVLRKKANMNKDSRAPPKPARPFGGRESGVSDSIYSPRNTSTSGGGDGRGSQSNGSYSYRRHPDDPAADDADVQEIDRLIRKRNVARRNRDFTLAGNIRTELKSVHRVIVNDRDHTWSTNPTHAERAKAGSKPTLQAYAATVHGYTLHKLASASLSPLREEVIHHLIAERNHCRVNRDFTRADIIHQQLMDAHVQLDDRRKLWRPDGIRFLPDGYEYKYAPNAGPSISLMPEEVIKELIGERFGRKISYDFTTADVIEAELKEAKVYVNDADRLWRADGKSLF